MITLNLSACDITKTENAASAETKMIGDTGNVIFLSSYPTPQYDQRWDPTEADVTEAEALLRTCLSDSTTFINPKVKDWVRAQQQTEKTEVLKQFDQYKRQYVGYINKDKQRILWINADLNFSKNYTTEIQGKDDGGYTIFDATINLDTKSCAHLSTGSFA